MERDCRTTPKPSIFDRNFLPYLLFGNWKRRLKVEIPAYSAMSFGPDLTLEMPFLLEKEIGK
jgi:hypothetical protein